MSAIGSAGAAPYVRSPDGAGQVQTAEAPRDQVATPTANGTPVIPYAPANLAGFQTGGTDTKGMDRPNAAGALQRRPPQSLNQDQVDAQAYRFNQATESGMPQGRVVDAGMRGLTSLDPNLTHRADRDGPSRTVIERGDREVWSGRTAGKGGDDLAESFSDATRSVLRDMRLNGNPSDASAAHRATLGGLSREENAFEAERGLAPRDATDFRA